MAMNLNLSSGKLEKVADVPSSGAAPENLADLAREADFLDAAPAAEAAAGAADDAAKVVQSNENELLSTLETLRAMVFPVLSMVVDGQRMAALAQVWSDQVLASSAQAGALVLAKHGIEITDVLGKFGPYVMLAAALAPPVFMTKKILEKPKVKPADAVASPANGQQ